MRGTPKVVSDNQPFVRIIPADAGNTHRGLCGKRPGQDHPRGCGEHASGMESCLTTRGSSPRMRGTRGHGEPADIHTGIIPADAGNTVPGIVGDFHGWDHPRGCGEHQCRLIGCGRLRGSSPRMRGTPVLRVGPGFGVRIIPADAGNTVLEKQFDDQGKDHPRGCGEHSPAKSMNMSRMGSSPRMRGTRAGLHEGLQHARIIPADAGNTGCIRP